MEAKDHKKHRKKHSGPKAEKKKKRYLQDLQLGDEEDARKRNPKAFAVQSAVRMARSFHRTQDLKTKKHHIPVVDRTPLEPPPIVVVVMGPPKVGKSTLIRCLIRNFTRQKLTEIRGPVTIVSGKKRRLTIIECGCDINVMIDLAKVADLVLMLIDASFGFEMETFEFLNICQVHGFPKIMGVLTHLDSFKHNKQLKKTKKRLKHRFWTEVYPGAKLFYLSGMVHGEYQNQEIHNLGRFITVMKFRPLTWQTSHPYILADRMEDLTNPEDIRTNIKCDRKVSLYGYLRGAYLKNNSQIHMPGVGDFAVSDVSFLPDPCALPEQQKKRCLNEKEKLVYAPLSGVGGVLYDKDAVYVDLGGSHGFQAMEEPGPTHELVQSLISTHASIDAKMASSRVTLFSDSKPLGSEDIDNQGLWMPKEEKQLDVKTGRVRRKAVFEDTEDESGDEDSEDDEEMSEGDRTGSGSSDEDEEEEEEEEGAKATSCKYLSGRGSKRPKLEEQEEDSEADLPAFADSDDDLKRSSGEEEAAEEADESSEDGGDSAAGERDIGDSKPGGGDSGPRSSAAREWRDRPDVERPSPARKAALTTSDSGHCTAEEAFPSEDESGDSELSSDEDSEHKEEVVRGKPASPQGGSGQKPESATATPPPQISACSPRPAAGTTRTPRLKRVARSAMSSEPPPPPPQAPTPHQTNVGLLDTPRARDRSPSPLRGNVVPSPLPTRRTRTFSATVRASQGPVYKGVCKCFCRSKGHGFITPADGGPDIFLHISDVEGEYVPVEGDEVTYKMCSIPPKNEKLQAVEVVITHLAPGTKHETWSGHVISS